MLDRKENDGNTPSYNPPAQKQTTTKEDPFTPMDEFPSDIPAAEGDDLPF